MGLAEVLIIILWAMLSGYAVLGGADFGGGVLDLLARGARGARQRAAISLSMGPVWEANHTWLIFFLAGLFAAFPLAFSTLGIALYLPLLLALVGIVLRGAAFAFRGHVMGASHAKSRFGAVFGIASVLTPLFFGATAGALAQADIRVDGDTVTAPGIAAIFTTPFAIACGVLALAVCTYLAATYLTVEMQRSQEPELCADFRVRALWAGAVSGALSIVALVIASSDATRLYDHLTGKALPLLIVGVLAGLVSFALMAARRYYWARPAAALAVVAVLWGWGVAQYPRLVGPDVTIASASSSHATQVMMLVCICAGAALLVPSLWLLYAMFRREPWKVPQ